MATDHTPLFKDLTGRLQRFGGEETLTWDFTSAAGNPMELVVGGATYFTFDRTGALTLESDILWNLDSGGDIGAQFDTRPATVHVVTTVAVGATGGANVGAKLELNTLTLGHGNVDKHIDAEQGLANTPFMRYNAVNTRWEYSNDGIVVIAFDAGFGVGTWDAIYATDKTLTIDTTTLAWTQTSTTHEGFSVSRNLAAGSTNATIVLIEQQHATDDQPALVVAQNATGVSALSIHDGLYPLGTERFSFIAEGQLIITTEAALAAAAISITQNDIDEPFWLTTGTAAVDASRSISTANAGTADMIRVVVDSGAGANTRWVPAYNAVALPAVNDWDAIYLNDKTLTINAAVLTWTQTTVTGRAFMVERNQAVDDNPIMVVEQQHAAASQPPLALGQVANAADVLQLYDGSVALGTMRFQFQPLGRLNIIGAAGLATEALRLELNNATAPFMEFLGTAAGGAGNNISTDNAGTADMLQVDVDPGTGAVKRWIPAYNATALPGAPSWDAIYLLHKHLDINAAVLQFEQTSHAGYGFEIFRDEPAATTTKAIVRIENQNNLDDQPALLLEGGIWGIAGGVEILRIQTTSHGLTGGTGDVLRSIKAVLTNSGGDIAGSEIHGYYVEAPSPLGAAETHGLHAAADLDYGVYSLASVLINKGSIITTDNVLSVQATSANLGNNQIMSGALVTVDEAAGDAATSKLRGVNIQLGGVAGGGTTHGLYVATGFDYGIYSNSLTYLTAPVNSTVLEIVGNLPTAATDFATITAISGNLGANAMRALVVDLTGHTLDTGTPVGIDLNYTAGGGTETPRAIDINAGWDYGLYSLSPVYIAAPLDTTGFSLVGQYTAGHGAPVVFGEVDYTSPTLLGTDSVTLFEIDAAQAAGDDGFSITIGLAVNASVAGGGINIGLTVNDNWKTGIASASPVNFTVSTAGAVLALEQTNAAGDIISATGTLGNCLAMTNAGKAIFTANTADDALIINQTSTGNILQLQDGGGAQWVCSEPAAITHTPTDPTANFDAHTITLTSGGINVNTIRALVINVTSLAGDIGANPFYGVDLLFTDGGGGTPDPRAVNVDANWNHGLYTLSPVYAAAPVNSKVVEIVGNPPTAATNFVSITATSGNAIAPTMTGLAIDLTGHLTNDNTCIPVGIDFNYNIVSTETALAMKVQPGFDYILSADSDPLATGASSIFVCNVGSGTDTKFISFFEGTVAVPVAERFHVRVDGTTRIIMNHATNGTEIKQANVTGGSQLLDLIDTNAAITRFSMDQEGQTDCEVNHATNGWRIGQVGAGGILALHDGTPAAGALRWGCTKLGLVYQVAANVTATSELYHVQAVSDGLADETLHGIRVKLTNNAGDTDTGGATNYYGIDLNITDDPGGASTSYAVVANSVWDYGLYVEARGYISENSTDTALTVKQSSTGDILLLQEGANTRLKVDNTGHTLVSTTIDLGVEALQIDQNDADKAFIDYAGTAGASGGFDAAVNIQTWLGGAGAVVGPKGQSAAEAYYKFEGMVKKEVNGAEMWMPYYSHQSS